MIEERLRGTTLTAPQQVGIALLAAVSLGLIGQTGLLAWQNPCPANSVDPTCGPFLADVIPLLTALGIWVTGVLVWWTGRAPLTISVFLVGACTLAAGTLSTVDDAVGTRLFALLLAVMTPLTIHFHLGLLDRPMQPRERRLLYLFAAGAALLALPSLVWPISTIREQGWYTVWRSILRLSIVVALLVAVLLLLREYRAGASARERRRIRLVVSGTIAGFAPFVWLSLLPDTLGAPIFVPFEWTFPWLLLSPLAYGYALFHQHLRGKERVLHRAATAYLLATLLLGLYLLLDNVLLNLVPNQPGSWSLFGALLIAVLAPLLFPLENRLQRLVNWVWYGNEISYSHIIEWLTRELSLALDQTTLRRLLLEELPTAMHLSGGALYLRNPGSALLFVAHTGIEGGTMPRSLPVGGQLGLYLEGTAKPCSRSEMQHEMAHVALRLEEQMLLHDPELAYWLPLVSDRRLQGLLLIGHRVGGDFFTAEDERILATIGQQAGIAAYNVLLVEEVQASREELVRAHQQLLVERERERRRVARDLHDGAIQQLAGINYQLQLAAKRLSMDNGAQSAAEVRQAVSRELEQVRQEVVALLPPLRQLIWELRPSGLEHVGLGAALKDYVESVQNTAGPGAPQIETDFELAYSSLPEPITISLFRVAQEALRNALRHAQAENIWLTLRQDGDWVELRVGDDGRGFEIPGRMSELTRENHFGLVGISEQMSLVGGTYRITSSKGQGTEVIATVPVNENDNDWEHPRSGS